jgi:presenilin-like A22 family membrane protease
MASDSPVASRSSLLGDPRIRGMLGTGALFLVVQILALAITPRLANRGVSYGEGGDALVPLVLGLVVGTLLALAVARWGLSPRVLKGLVFFSLGVSVWFATAAFLGPLVGAIPAALAALAVWQVPRWEVRNTITAVGVAGAAGVFGASLSPEYAAVALLVVAVYDAYSVYWSGHMIDLADTSAQLQLPNAFVVPTSDAYDDEAVRVGPENEGEGGQPAAALLGAGDALFPAMLAASADAHTATLQIVGGGPPLGIAPSAIGAVLGGIVGFVLLQLVVQYRGGVHAGLPLLNGGAVAGWLLFGGTVFL